MAIPKVKENAFIVFLILFLVISSSLLLTFLEGRAPRPYSSYSTEEEGSKGAYLLLDKLGFSISRAENGVDNLTAGSVIIIAEPVINYAADMGTVEMLNRWVYQGNTLVLIGSYKKYFTYASDENNDSALSGLAEFTPPEGSVKPYCDLKYGSGSFRVIPYPGLLTNGGLKEEGSATALVTALWDFHDKPLAYYEKGPETLLSLSPSWNSSPLGLLNNTWKLILLQCLVGFALLGFFSGKRLGQPLAYHKEAVREENEDISAISGLLGQANLQLEALNLYYRQFEKEASSYFKVKIAGDTELLESLWKQYSLKFPEKLSLIHRYVPEGKDDKLSGESMVQLFQHLDSLREEIVKHE
jgi:hypothetical protein